VSLVTLQALPSSLSGLAVQRAGRQAEAVA
jgi:hypothetical protein